MRLGTVRSPTPISRRLSSISSQKRSNSAWQRPAPPSIGLQPPQHHPQMQHQQVKTAVNRVRHAQVPIKQRFSRLRHDHAIDGLNGAAQGYPGFPEVIERPKHCGFRKRALYGPAHVAILRAARYVNASRDARGRDQFRNDRDEPETLTRALSARPGRALARSAQRCRRRAGLRGARRLHRRAVPEGLYPAARRARANPDRREPGSGADRDGNAVRRSPPSTARCSTTSRSAPSARSPS